MLGSKQQNEPVKRRHYKISRKKAILFPVINWIGPDLEEAIKEIDIIEPKAMDVTLDGEQIKQNAVRGLVPEFNYLHRKMSTDGYWIFIKPESLEKGKHTINSFGSCRAGLIKIEIGYDLDVVG